MIASIKVLRESITANGEFVFETRPQRLTAFRILLFCIATGDFNAAHCMRAFLPYSLFSKKKEGDLRLVSHGIATLARAEEPFVRLMEFAEIPKEIIAIGVNAEYKKPLYEGDWYYYRYTLTNLRLEKNLWRVDCHITCMALSPGESNWHSVAEESWSPAFVEKSDVPAEARELLRIKSYARNVLDALIMRPAQTAATFALAIFAAGLLLGSLAMPVLSVCGHHSPYFDAAIQMSAQTPPL
jgi:hypothetical protein